MNIDISTSSSPSKDTSARVASSSRAKAFGMSNGWTWRRASKKALVEFTRSFAVMVQARVPLDRALAIGITQCKDETLRGVLEEVHRDVRRGSSLSEACSKHPDVFTSFFVHLIHIGEVAGVLDRVLQRLASHMEKSMALKRKVAFALFYPGLILTVSIGAVVFFLVAIVPTFAEMYRDFGEALPAPTQVILRASTILTGHFPVLLGAFVAVLLGVGAVLQRPRGRWVWDRFKLRIPLVRGVLRKTLAARFCRTFGTLLASGVSLVESLSILVNVSTNTFVEHQLDYVKQRVQRGSPLAGPLKNMDVFPDMVVQLVAVGEETAELPDMLIHAADHFEQEVDVQLDGMASVIEPVLIVVIGLILGGILVALYLPMFELINTVG